MAKIRFIKPETWTDEKFVDLSPLARLMFVASWNFACDNGHLDDKPRQLKMRTLPAEDCDPVELIAELVTAGVVERRNGYLKVANLSEHQRPDLRFLVFCEHCAHDEHATYAPSDKKPRTTRAPRALDERSTGARRNGDGDGGCDGEGDGEGDKATTSRRKPERAIPDDWQPTTKHHAYAKERGLDLSGEAFRFRNHAHTHDRRCVNWNAAFTNWLSKAYPTKDAKRGQMPEGW